MAPQGAQLVQGVEISRTRITENLLNEETFLNWHDRKKSSTWEWVFYSTALEPRRAHRPEDLGMSRFLGDGDRQSL